MNDADSPATLAPSESPDLLNVESNLQGTAILKRKGFQKTADLTISTGPVTGSHSFIDSSGNRQDIVCNDKYCAHSVNGNAFANFLSTAAAGVTRWSWVDVGGAAYGANNRRDPILKYDGTTLSYPATMPQASILELAQSRLVAGDILNNPNRVWYSSAGAYEQFTIGANQQDSYFDDIGAPGDRVRGIKCIGGVCYIFKSNSLTTCEVSDQYNSQCSVLSPTLGTTDPASIIAAGDYLYFRAQDKNYWELGPRGLSQISKKIPNLVKSQSGGLTGGENSNTQTTKADWDAGTQSPPSSWNTTIINGSIFPSSITLIDNTTAQWVLGAYNLNVDTSGMSGAGLIKLSSTVAQDSWSNGNFAGRLVWTQAPSNWGINPSNGYLTEFDKSANLGNVIYESSVTISSGSWGITTQSNFASGNCTRNLSIVGDCWDFRFLKNAGNSYYSLRLHDDPFASGADTFAQLIRNVGGTETILTNYQFQYLPNTDFAWQIVRSSAGAMFVYMNSVFISSTPADVSISSATKVEIAASASAATSNDFSKFYAYQYASSGTLLSQAFDTTYTTPTFGVFGATASVLSGEGQVNFYTQTSANGSTGWTTTSAASDTTHINSASNRYVRYKADFFTFISTKTPTVTGVSLNAATTGQFTTQCITPNYTISAWGQLTCAQTLAGAGSMVFYATSAATCATLPTSQPTAWQTSVTNNATLSISTNSAVKIGWRSLLGSATDQAQIDACVLSWNEGTPAQPSWATYDSVKNAIYWTTTINGAATSNRLLKYDRNLSQWYPFDIPAQAPKIINNSLYFGGASSGTWNLYGGVDSDAGYDINAYWKSKDIGSDSPFQEKSFKTLSILSRNNGTGSMTGTWTLSNSQTGNYTISLATGTGINYARSNFNLPFASPQQFMNVRMGNASSTPFEVLGLGLTWTVNPWRVSGP